MVKIIHRERTLGEVLQLGGDAGDAGVDSLGRLGELRLRDGGGGARLHGKTERPQGCKRK